MKPFVIERVYDAPRERVWAAWTEAERLKAWFTPAGFTMVRCTMDLRPGGLFHYLLRMPDGQDLWGRWVMREIAKPERLVFVVSFSDPGAGISTHPMNPAWPREMHSTVRFAALGARTKVSVEWLPLEGSTDLEKKAFDDGRDSLKMGWGGTLDHLTGYLAR